MATQLLLFPETFEQIMIKKVSELQEKQDKTRKSQYAKIGELKAKYDEMQSKLSYLEAALCKAGYIPYNDINGYLKEIVQLKHVA